MAAWEREIISERTKIALAVKREKKERISGRAPYGYRFENGALVIDRLEQATLTKIRELQADGMSIRGIVTYLSDNAYRNRAGKNFGACEVWKMAKVA